MIERGEIEWGRGTRRGRDCGLNSAPLDAETERV